MYNINHLVTYYYYNNCTQSAKKQQEWILLLLENCLLCTEGGQNIVYFVCQKATVNFQLYHKFQQPVAQPAGVRGKSAPPPHRNFGEAMGDVSCKNEGEKNTARGGRDGKLVGRVGGGGLGRVIGKYWLHKCDLL